MLTGKSGEIMAWTLWRIIIGAILERIEKDFLSHWCLTRDFSETKIPMNILTSHTGDLRIESWLCSWFQRSANMDYRKAQVMARVVRAVPPA